MTNFVENNKNAIVLLGITDGNIQRLREGRPIHIHGEEMNLPGVEIWIITGRDEATLGKQLAPLIGPETIVRDMQKAPKQ